jgi:hypothetical protein
MARNKEVMAQLGLVEASRALQPVTIAPYEQRFVAPPKPRRRTTTQPHERASKAPSAPARSSKRLRAASHHLAHPNAPSCHEVPTTTTTTTASGTDHHQNEAPSMGERRRGGSRKALLELPPNVHYAAPFTLLSIQTTVWDLGAVHRGAWAQRYWSSPGCLYHHAYPVGYRATKVAFDRTYEMRIETGTSGPEFVVKDAATGREFRGTSPTKPWTEVCVAHRTGQRISGPLYFGFSDPITQRAIAASLYDERELKAALAGERIEAQTLTAEEIAAKDFMTALKGVGEAVAAALARSTALGGGKHDGVASLRAWVQANERDNARVLQTWLLESEELPVATLRWPAWRMRLVPEIVKQLSADASVDVGGG